MSASIVFKALLVFAAFFSASADPMKISSELELLAHKEFSMLLDAFGGDDEADERYTDKKMLGTFSYENCGKNATEEVIVSSMDIKPDPLVLPADIIENTWSVPDYVNRFVFLPWKVNISFDSVIKTKFGKPLSAKLVVKKKILGLWIEVPCIDNIGSCTYDNICDELSKVAKTCPPALVKQGFNCSCPVSSGNVSLKNYSVQVNKKIPSVADGGVKVEIKLLNGKTQVTCLQITMDLK